MGLSIGDTHLFTLSFADNQAVLAQDSFDMEFMPPRLYSEYIFSLNKMEHLLVNPDARFEVLINDNAVVKQVDQFKYLGVMVDDKGIGSQNIR